MAEETVDSLLIQLREVEDQIKEMTGAPDFNVGSLSIDESELYRRLVEQRADLNLRIGYMRAGAASGDNCGGSAFGME